MSRWISLAFVVALAVLLALLPPAPASRLAALNAYSLLAEPPTDSPGHSPADSAAEGRPTLAELVLAGPASSTDAEGVRHVELGGVRVEGPTVDIDDHGAARDSVVRGLREAAEKQALELVIDGELVPRNRGGVDFVLRLEEGRLALRANGATAGSESVEATIDWRPPLWTSMLPPFLAILLAILFRRPVLALFLGVLGGAVILKSGAGAGGLQAVGGGLADVARTYFVAQLLDRDRQLIVGFVVFMLAMVGILTRTGGIRGLMDLIARYARSARSTLISTWLMGLAVFFDDYANTILVGTTMRPLCDRFKISREKLSYIVDSTAAPVAGISLFSTWVAYEVSTFSAQLPAAGISSREGYSIFLATLPYRFYCIFTLAFVGFLVFSGRDFGPMLTAERRARLEGKLARDGSKPMVGEHVTALEVATGTRPRAAMALVPLVAFIGVTVGMILIGGGIGGLWERGDWSLRAISQVLKDGSGNHTLFWGSLSGLVCSVVLAAGAGLIREVPRAAWTSLRSMGVALVILYLAWMMGAVCNDLGTANYLSVLLSGKLYPVLLPAILFVLAAVVAFSTGSSWSTMSILLPLVVGLAFHLGGLTELGGYGLMILSIGAVLEGAIFGDHCSPISDTTVLSSIASASDHIDHVRTQAPYAVLTMVVALLFGYLPCAMLDLSPWIANAAGIACLFGVLLWRGRHPEEALSDSPAR